MEPWCNRTLGQHSHFKQQEEIININLYKMKKAVEEKLPHQKSQLVSEKQSSLSFSAGQTITNNDSISKAMDAYYSSDTRGQQVHIWKRLVHSEVCIGAS